MFIIGCDFHTGFQQVAIFDKQTGEITGNRLRHPEEAREFYSGLDEPVLVGMEVCGYTQWFERLLAELGHELWIGDAARIRWYGGRRRMRGMLSICCSCCCIGITWCAAGRR